MQHRASGPEWGRINESILLQGPKTPAIKDKSSRYTLDLDTDWECVWRRGTPQSHSCILQLCSYFGFLIIPRLHLRPSAPESSPPPAPSSNQHWLFSGAKQGVIKMCSYSQHGRWRQTALHIQKADQWKRFLLFSLSAKGNKTSMDAASNCDHEMTSRLCSGQGDGFSFLLTNTCLLPADKTLSVAQSSSLFLDKAFKVCLVLAKIIIKSSWNLM